MSARIGTGITSRESARPTDYSPERFTAQGQRSITIITNQKEIAMFKINRIMKFLACLVLVAAFTGCAPTSQQEGTGEYIDDTVITTKVKTAILNDPMLKVMQINVETFKGEVQLSGFVDSAASVKRAAEVARSVKGVVGVKNDLIVK
ncbi:MAG: BON domain-containing protein [Desulfuromonadales bacterium]|nr:BON domain-containing protein [Desulfuromonadales bacterium]